MKPGVRELIFTVVLSSIPLVTWQIDFRPRRARQEEIKRQIRDKRAKLARLQDVSGVIGRLKQEVAENEKAVAFLRTRLPDEKEIDQVVKEVWHLAKSNNLSAKSVRTLASQEAKRFTALLGPHGEQAVMLQLQGDFRGFYGFLLAMENQSRIMRVRKMIIKKLKVAPEGHMFATIEIAVFFERKGAGEPPKEEA